MRIAFAVLAATLCLPALAAEPAADPGVALAKSQMAKLSALAGKWKGGGWIQMRQPGRTVFEGEETVEPRLDGAALAIEGRHRDPGTRAVIHHALGILSFDIDLKAYRMSSALANGRAGSYTGQVEGSRFTWFLESPGAPRRRFVISLDEPDRWVEVGEYTLDGANWVKFFEMDLKRVK